MTYFFRLRAAAETAEAEARVGLTTGRVLGKAVERNRIRRRMREAVRMHVAELPAGVDVVLHPRRTVLEMDFDKLEREVAHIFGNIAGRTAAETRQ